MSLCQRVMMESISNYVFFATLTYNNESLPSVTTSTGYDITYADWSDVQLMFKRLRSSNSFTRPFRYVCVSELGSKRGRPHFHLLLFIPKYESDDKLTPLILEPIVRESLFKEWRRNYGSRRKPIWKPLCTYHERYIGSRIFKNFDCHYVVPSVDDDGVSSVAFYVIKYMLKRSDREIRLQQALRLNLSDDEYNDIWSLVHSRVDTSLYFGLNPDSDGNPDPKILDYLHECISRSSDFAKFFTLSDGKSFPLAKYYKSRGYIYSFDDAMRFKELSETCDTDNFVEYDAKSYSQLIKSVRDYEKKISDVVSRGDFDNYSL